MAPAKVAAFPDTNLFLHYRPLAEFDWCAILQTAVVEIKIAPIVTRELEEKKTLHPIRRIRDRAESALRLLHSFLKQQPPIKVRTGVTLDFLAGDASKDFLSSYDLNLQIADDRLIGSLLLFREKQPDYPCILVTHDFPLTVKARHFQIEVVEPDDALRLPDEPDANEKKITQLEEELRQYKSRQPVLHLQFENGEKHKTFKLPSPSPSSEPEIQSMLTTVKQKYPLTQPPPETKVAPSALDDPQAISTHLTQSLLDQVQVALQGISGQGLHYDDRLKAYYRDYEKYLRESFAFKELLRRAITLDLVLVNAGTFPAEDIRLFLHFPDGLTVYDEERPPSPPEEPAVPSKEMTLIPALSGLSFPSLGDFAVPNPNLQPNIRKTNSYEVDYSFPKLSHQFQLRCVLNVAFDSWDSAVSFSFEYRIHAGNTPSVQKGELFVIVERK